MFVVEGLPHNIHIHSLWRVPKGPAGANRFMRFHKLFPAEQGGVWNEIVSSGTYKLRIMTDHTEAMGYIMKDQHMDSDGDLIMWSTEFARVQ
jgi:hypothetical protein